MRDGYRSETGPADDDLDEALLDALLSRVPASLHVYDRELRLVRVNTAARRLREFPLDRMLGRPLPEILRTFDVVEPGVVERAVQRVLESGDSVFDLRIQGRSRRDPAVEAVVSADVIRLERADGSVLGAAVSLTDVTARLRAEAGLRLLNDAAARVGSTLDVFRTAAEFATVAVPRVADTVTVDVYDAVLRGHAPAPDSRDRGAALRRAGFRSVAGHDQQGVPMVGEIDTYPPATPYRAALDTLAPKLIRTLRPDATWLDPRRRRDARIMSAGAHSMLLVPIRARGVVLGLACFYRWRNPTPFDHQDLALAEQLTAHAALCLDNARQYGRERSTARLLTGRLSHPESHKAPAVDLAHTYLPAGSGGAWFDVIPLSGARTALVAGDTADESASADPSAMGELRAAVEALSDLDLPPDEILERLHDLISRPGPLSAAGPSAVQPSPASCLYLVYDPVSRLCTAASAGHPAPVLLHPDGQTETLDIATGSALGRGIGHYRVSERVLPEGAGILLYNAALVADPPLGAPPLPERIAHAIATPSSSPQALCDALARDLSPERLHHDAYLLLARTRALGSHQTNAWTFPNAPEIVSRARQAATVQLAPWGVAADLADNTALIVSELVTNAIRYADGPIQLRLIIGDTLICEITDDSSTAPHLRRALDTDENGRGLYITAQLTRRWGVRSTHRGKTIWAEQDLTPPPALSRPEAPVPVTSGVH